MYKVTYSIGRVNRFINLKFSVILRNSKAIDSIKRNVFNGNQYLVISGLFPTLTIELCDEIRDMNSSIWNTNRSVSITKFQAKSFVQYGKNLLSKFSELKDLFGYSDKILLVNKELAWENREVMQTEYGKRIMLLATVVEDPDTHVQYEGISFMINEISNYAMLTYQEFDSMLRYIDSMDFDTLGLIMLNTALLMRSNKPIAESTIVTKQEDSSDLPQDIESEISDAEKKEEPNVENVQWRSIQNDSQIPKI